MRLIQVVAFYIIAGMLAVGLAGCTGKQGAGPTPGTTQRGDIPVGAYLSLTGPEADFGKTTREGIELALDEINGSGGIHGRKIRLIVENNESDAAKAASAVTKLITNDKVVAIVGEIASGLSLAAAPICQRNRIPMVSPSSTNIKVTQVGDYIFRVCFIDPFQAYVVAKFARDTLKANTAAIFVDNQSPYSRDFGAEFKKHFTRMGGRIVADLAYAATDTDFKAQLTKIKAANPDVILVPGYYKSVGAIGKQARELGIKVPLLGGDGWDSQDIFTTAGDALEGCYFSNHMAVDDPNPTVRRFVEAFRKKYGAHRMPGALTALGYDAMMILADAMKRAKSLDGPNIRDALAQTKGYQGVTGTITINAQRNADKPAVILQIKGRKFVYRETIPQPQTASGS
jgi:branched-chain amino acid transport system substrate-binding protein